MVLRMKRSYHPELVFLPHFFKIVVEVKASGPPHVSKLWFGVRKGMLPVDNHQCFTSGNIPKAEVGQILPHLLRAYWSVGLNAGFGYRGRRFEPRQQYVVSLSKTLYPHCLSRLSC